MVTPKDATVIGIVQRLAGRLRHPALFFILVSLFLLDLVVPDLLPFVDEAMLGLLAVLAGTWTKRREQPTPPAQRRTDGPREKDVTPPEEKERIRDFDRR